VLRLIVGHGMQMVAGGVGAGVVAALVLTRLAASLLFGIGAHDPGAFAGVSVLLLLLAFVACVVPAARASRLEPASVLRSE
jgi:putative ABC transport system permease protein